MIHFIHIGSRPGKRRLYLCIYQIQYCLCQKILNHLWPSTHILWTTKSFFFGECSFQPLKERHLFLRKNVCSFLTSIVLVASYTILQHSAKVFFHYYQKTGHKNASKLSLLHCSFVCFIFAKTFQYKIVQHHNSGVGAASHHTNSFFDREEIHLWVDERYIEIL